MNKWALYCRQERFLYFFAISTSLILSLWIGLRESVVNPDAICYLLAAETVGQSGVRSAMQLCGQAAWPFYSILIYSLSTLSHLSYTTAAYTLDSLFSAISVTTFILIVKELGGSKRCLWLAAIVILLAHQFNSVREYIVRDHGFWAFYLGSLWLLLRYFKRPRILRALAWSACSLVAALFRVEGIIFILLIPFSAWFYFHRPFSQRIKSFLYLNLPLLIIIGVMSFWFLQHPHQNLGKFGRLAEIPQQLQHAFSLITERYQHTEDALAQHVLTADSTKEAGWLLLVLMFGWYFVSVVSNLAFPYAVLALFALRQRILNFTPSAKLVLFSYLIVNLIVTMSFLFEHLFLSKRYLIALSLLLMLLVPFALEHLLRGWSLLRYRLALYAISLCILFSAAGGIVDFGYSKAYIREAGDWLSENVPFNAALYANDYQLMYYSQHFGNHIFEKLHPYLHPDTIAHEQWKQYDYAAFRLDKKNAGSVAKFLADVPCERVRTFSNRRGDQVAIYKVFH